MSAASTTHFGLPIPRLGAKNWGQTILDWFNAAERTLGCNVNLIMAANVDEGAGVAGTLVSFGGAESVLAAHPAGGRWGRAVLQAPMVSEREVLSRLLGVSVITGPGISTELGATIYHAAGGATFTTDPTDAAVDGGNSIQFLPLGYAFAGGTEAFIVGTMPIQACPVRMTGRGRSHKPGIQDPTADWVEVFDAGPALEISFDGSGQVIDLVFPWAVPGDFRAWIDKSGGSFWALRAVVKVTGAANVEVLEIIDSDGDDVPLSVGTEDPTAWANADAAQSDLLDAEPTITPSTTVYIRVRATGDNGDTVRIRPHLMVQYFPVVRWQ